MLRRTSARPRAPRAPPASRRSARGSGPRARARPAALAQSCVATASIGTRWSAAKPSMSAGCFSGSLSFSRSAHSSSSISSARQSSPRTARTRAAGASPSQSARHSRAATIDDHDLHTCASTAACRCESRPCAAVCCNRSSSTSSGSDTSASDASRARTRAAARAASHGAQRPNDAETSGAPASVPPQRPQDAAELRVAPRWRGRSTVRSSAVRSLGASTGGRTALSAAVRSFSVRTSASTGGRAALSAAPKQQTTAGGSWNSLPNFSAHDLPANFCRRASCC